METTATPITAGHVDGTITIPGLSRRLKTILKFASEDKGRPQLCGVRFEADPTGGVNLVATDGHRLIVDHVADGEMTGTAAGITIDRVTLKVITLAPEAEEISTIRFHAEKTDKKPADRWEYVKEFVKESSIVTFEGLPGNEFPAIVAEQFPDWRYLIPADCPQRLDFTADRKALLKFAREALKKYSNRKCPLVSLNSVDGWIFGSYWISDKNGTYSIGSPACGSPADPAAWIAETLAFNARYLVDGLTAFTGKKIRFQVKGTASACVLREGGRVMILMPVRM